ncbi:myb protein [Cryptosporidium felis]|nr:myb protein [Cryptosporidium felis]
MPQEPWNAEEDELLYQLVQRLGPSSWSETARLLNSTLNVNRLAKQCRERWISHVDPRIRRGDWSLSEDRFILNQQNIWGNRWADIARHLPGRTTHAVKNRYHQLQRLLNQGKTKLETILNAPLIHVVPHFLQQTNNTKESTGKIDINGNSQKTKKTIVRKKRVTVNNSDYYNELESINKPKDELIFSIDKTTCNKQQEKIHSMNERTNFEVKCNFFEEHDQKLDHSNGRNAINHKFQPIESNKKIKANSEIETSPVHQKRPCLEFQQSPPGVLLTSDIGIYPVTPRVLDSSETYKVYNASEPSTCETNQDDYVSKLEYSTPSSELNENVPTRCVQTVSLFSDGPDIYNEIEYREPNWFCWSDNNSCWEDNQMNRLYTGSIVDPFFHSFPE